MRQRGLRKLFPSEKVAPEPRIRAFPTSEPGRAAVWATQAQTPSQGLGGKSWGWNGIIPAQECVATQLASSLGPPVLHLYPDGEGG